MSDYVKVQFKASRRGFFANPLKLAISVGDYVVVEGERGNEIGEVIPGCPRYERNRPSGGKGTPKVLKVAGEEEKGRLREMGRLEEEAKKVCQQKISEKKIPMNLVDVECDYDLNKLNFYFTAEKRVDFRELIGELAAIFHKRIKMRQIGVRDKAKRFGGFGRCGMPLCCAMFITEFEPVTLKAAKEQNLSLNPSNISGCCGRLMCCLVYERDFYRECRKRFPQVGKEIVIKQGKEKVVGVDIFRDRVALQGDSGGKRFVALKEFHRVEKRSESGK